MKAPFLASASAADSTLHRYQKRRKRPSFKGGGGRPLFRAEQWEGRRTRPKPRRKTSPAASQLPLSLSFPGGGRRPPEKAELPLGAERRPRPPPPPLAREGGGGGGGGGGGCVAKKGGGRAKPLFSVL